MYDANHAPVRRGASLLATRAANTVRYSLMNLYIVAGAVSMALGGWWMWFGFASTFLVIGAADELVGDAGDREDMPPAWYMKLMLWLTLPLLVLATVLCLNTIGGGHAFIDAALAALDFDPVAAHAATGPLHAVGGLISLGVFYGLGGVNVAHELVHRTDSRFDMVLGRWLLAFTWDTGFAIEHVYGHHRNVGTPKDPATARRGEYIARFIVRSTVGQVRAAYEHEKARLIRRGIPDRPWTNRFWRGQFMTLAVVALFVAMLGPVGILASLFAAAVGKSYLEMVNYVEHYGLVRMPGTRVEPRHSWDSYRRLYTGVTYNLPLHSDHHMFAHKHFWELQHQENDAPMLPMGYMPMILCAFWWRKFHNLMKPRLADWDNRLASPQERDWLRQHGMLLRDPSPEAEDRRAAAAARRAAAAQKRAAQRGT